MIRYLARTVLPIDAPPIEDGGVVLVRGDRIVRVGRRSEVPPDGAVDRDLGDVVLLPGGVNAHVHLDLSWIGECRPDGGDWVSWVARLVALRDREDADRAVAAAARAVSALRGSGTVAVGDIANRATALVPLCDAGLHGVVFHELFRLDERTAGETLERGRIRVAQMRGDVDRFGARDRLRVALTAHAPHTTSPALVRGIAAAARDEGVPLSIHVAESEAESTWLRDGSGPLAAFYRGRGLDEFGWRPSGASPVAHLDGLAAIGPASLLVHAVRVNGDDIDLVLRRGATVVTCPRSNAYLGVGAAPVPELLRRGVPVALGTDSLASCPDLDVFREMTALLDVHPELRPRDAVIAGTLTGARALGVDDRLGTLAPGKLAAMAAVPWQDGGGDPWTAVVSASGGARAVGVFAA